MITEINGINVVVRNLRNFQRANWTEFRQLLDTSIRVNRDLDSPVKVDAAIETFTKYIQLAMEQNVPVTTIHTNNLPDFLNEDIKAHNRL